MMFALRIFLSREGALLTYGRYIDVTVWRIVIDTNIVPCEVLLLTSLYILNKNSSAPPPPKKKKKKKKNKKKKK